MTSIELLDMDYEKIINDEYEFIHDKMHDKMYDIFVSETLLILPSLENNNLIHAIEEIFKFHKVYNNRDFLGDMLCYATKKNIVDAITIIINGCNEHKQTIKTGHLICAMDIAYSLKSENNYEYEKIYTIINKELNDIMIGKKIFFKN